MIDISKLNKAEVLAALYNASRAQGMGFLHYTPNNMTTDEAQRILDASSSKYFDYLIGRVMKVDLSGEEFDPWLYDRDNGQGAAQSAVDSIMQVAVKD